MMTRHTYNIQNTYIIIIGQSSKNAFILEVQFDLWNQHDSKRRH